MSEHSTKANRASRGASMIMLVMLIGLVVIPTIGVFTFEVNRYQEIQRQLEKIVDAAALAGGRKMLEADVTAAGTDTNLAILWRQYQGMNAAYGFITSQQAPQPLHIINSVGLNANSGQPGYMQPWFSSAPPPPPVGPNVGVVQICPCDPMNKFAPVTPGDPKGSAILVKVVYNENPAFGKYLGVGAVPVTTASGTSAAATDIVLCLDMSASMDDCTRVTTVNEVVRMTDSGITLLQGGTPGSNPMGFAPVGPPPPEPDYSSCNFSPPTMCGAAQQTCMDGVYNSYYPLYDAWAAKFDQVRDGSLALMYTPTTQGRLIDVVKQSGLIVGPEGTTINVLPHRHLYKMMYPNAEKDYAWLPSTSNQIQREGTPATGRACGITGTTTCNGLAWNYDPASKSYTFNWDAVKKTYNFGSDRPGFDAMVANLGPFVNNPPSATPNFGADLTGQQLTIPTAPFTYAGKSFSNLPTLVEASSGTLDTPGAWKAKLDAIETQIVGTSTGSVYKNTVASIGGALPEGVGYQKAYQSAAKKILQPYGTVIQAAQTFINSISGTGDAVRVGFVGFDTDTANQIPAPGTVVQEMVADTPPPGIAPEPDQPQISVGLSETSNVAEMTTLQTQLSELVPLRKTNIGQALIDAHQILQNALSQSGGRPAQQIIVLITDGINSIGPDPVNVVKGWGNNQIPVYCVGLNQFSKAEDPSYYSKMQQTLGDSLNGTGQGVAFWSGNGAVYYQAPDPTSLQLAMASIARRLNALGE